MTFDAALSCINGAIVARCVRWAPNVYLDRIGDGYTVWQRRLGNDASRVVCQDTGARIDDDERGAEWEAVPLASLPRLDNEIGRRA